MLFHWSLAFYEGNCEMSLTPILFAEITRWGWGVCGCLWHGREFWGWCLCMQREGPNERPAWQIALQRAISSLQLCALFLLHRSDVTNYILLCLSSDISVTLFGSQFHILSATAAPNLDFLSDKMERFQFLSPSRHFDEVPPTGTTDDSASYWILTTFGLIFIFFCFNFCIHFEEVNKIIFFLAGSNRNWIKLLDLSHFDDY